MKLLVLVPLFVSCATAVSFYEVVSEEWSVWKLTHNVTFGGDDAEKYRFKIFAENKVNIAKHNSKYRRGEKSYALAMNQFGHLLHHEFTAMMNGYLKDKKVDAKDGATQLLPAHVELPGEVDWRKHGAVTPVKDQGQCGSCWAFSSTGALEGAHFRKTGKLVSLSEQNLVDCSLSFGNEGCEGGLMDNAFRYVKANGGIDTEASYPYEGLDDPCRFRPSTVGATDKGFVDVKQGDEQGLKAAVATVGPVSVAIDASHQTFQFYSHGVYEEEDCTAENLDHGVLVVGYGTEGGKDYWLVKNSWAETWGLDGYIKMARNQENMCGIASSASYPLV